MNNNNNNIISNKRTRRSSNQSPSSSLSRSHQLQQLQQLQQQQRPNQQHRRRQSFRQCQSFCCHLITFFISHLGLLSLVVLYVMVGGMVFRAIEKSHELSVQNSMLQLRQNTLENLIETFNQSDSSLVPAAAAAAVRLMRNNNSQEYAAGVNAILINYTAAIVNAVNSQGWNGHLTEEEMSWSFEGSLLFAVTVITTIGFGHVTPKTSLGRLMTIIYAVFGIPLTFLFVTHCGDNMARLFKVIYSCVQQRMSSSSSSTRRLTTTTTTTTAAAAAIQATATATIISHSKVSLTPEWNESFTMKMRYYNAMRMRPSRLHHHTGPSLLRHSCTESCFVVPLAPPALAPPSVPPPPPPQTTTTTTTTATKPALIIENIAEESINNDNHLINQSQKTEIVILNPVKIEHVTVPLSLSLLVMLLYILLGATVFIVWEDKDFIKWSYFCFTTLSTIGFGDIVPGTKIDAKNPKTKMVLVSFYVALGLALVAMCFKLMQEEVLAKAKRFGKRLRLIVSSIRQNLSRFLRTS